MKWFILTEPSNCYFILWNTHRSQFRRLLSRLPSDSTDILLVIEGHAVTEKVVKSPKQRLERDMRIFLILGAHQPPILTSDAVTEADCEMPGSKQALASETPAT